MKALVTLAAFLWCMIAYAGHKLPDEAAGLLQRPGANIPLSLPFLDDDAHAVTLNRYFAGQPVLLLLAYYHCPNLCGTILENLRDTVSALRLQPGSDFQAVVVGIDPNEGPAQAQSKKKQLSLPSPTGWHFLTGNRDSISRLADAVGVRFSYDPARDEYAHPAVLVLLTPAGRLTRYLFGVPFVPSDLRLGLIEAGQGKIGSVLDRLLLVCYDFDPATGRYTPAVIATVRALGIFTIAMLLLLWWRLQKRTG